MVRNAGLLLVAACFTLPLASLVATTATGAPGVVLTVNGAPLAQRELDARLKRVGVQTVSPSSRSFVVSHDIVKQCVREMLLTQLAEREHVAPTDAQVDQKLKYLVKRTGGNFRSQLRQMGTTEQEWKDRMMLQQCVVNLLARQAKVSDAEIRGSYDAEVKRIPSRFVRPAACRISVIIAKSKARIDKAYNKLQKGDDFGSVAMQLSEDKTTAPYQGMVGWLSMDMTVVPKVIRTTAFSLQTGKYSKPFFVQDKSDKAWVIVKVDQKRAGVTESFDSVKEMIGEQLALKKADRSAFNKMVRDFVAKARIVVNDQRYKDVPAEIKSSAAKGEVFTKYIPSQKK